MNALAKQKECDVIGKWEKSVINHLYWCVSSSAADDQTLIKAKWLSIVNHVHNKHTGHGKKFPKCLHKRLQGRDRKKKWLKTRTSYNGFDFNFYVYSYHYGLQTQKLVKSSQHYYQIRSCAMTLVDSLLFTKPLHWNPTTVSLTISPLSPQLSRT